MSVEDPTEQIYAYPVVIQILDRLKEMLNEGAGLPMTAKVLVNKVEALELLEQAHSVLPEDVVNAGDIVKQAADVISQADAEAEYVRSEAESQAQSLRAEAEEFAASTRENAQMEANRILTEADAQADQIVNDARNQAHQLLADADAEAEARVSESQILREATQRAQDLEERTNQEADELAMSANRYADDRLADLEELLAQIGADVRSSRQDLQRRLAQH